MNTDVLRRRPGPTEPRPLFQDVPEQVPLRHAVLRGHALESLFRKPTANPKMANSSPVGVLFGESDGRFTFTRAYSCRGPITWMGAGDVTGDGQTDVICGSTTVITVRPGNGTRTLGSANHYEQNARQSWAGGNFNNDDRADILILDSPDGFQTVQFTILLSTESGFAAAGQVEVPYVSGKLTGTAWSLPTQPALISPNRSSPQVRQGRSQNAPRASTGPAVGASVWTITAPERPTLPR